MIHDKANLFTYNDSHGVLEHCPAKNTGINGHWNILSFIMVQNNRYSVYIMYKTVVGRSLPYGDNILVT